MSQPVPYVKATDFQSEEIQQVAGRSTVRSAALDSELDGIFETLQGVLNNLAIIQRDDGKLRDNFVDIYSLGSDVLGLMSSGSWVVRGAWATATAYVLGDFVESGGFGYICVVAHTSAALFSTDFAAKKWVAISADAASLISFTPFSPVNETNVQAAIQSAWVFGTIGFYPYMHDANGGI